LSWKSDGIWLVVNKGMFDAFWRVKGWVMDCSDEVLKAVLLTVLLGIIMAFVTVWLVVGL
jgi:hypothetical protein